MISFCIYIDIYTGKIVNWKDAGGNDAPITVVNKAEGRSTLELFLHYFGLKNTDAKPQVVIGDNQQGIKTVVIVTHNLAQARRIANYAGFFLDQRPASRMPDRIWPM